MAANTEENFPTELNDRLTAFDDSLTNVDSVLQILHDLPLTEIHEKASPLDKARLDIVGAYAMNSLFWMYLNSVGENPKDHAVKQELDRIRKYMDRVKEVHDNLLAAMKRPQLNKDASKRFIRNALWKAAKEEADKRNREMQTDNSGAGPWDQDSTPVSGSTKRVNDDNGDKGEPKKKKKKKKKGHSADK